MAAKEGRVDEKIIFDIYKQIPHSLNSLINAKNLYQTYEGVNSRSLIYQKLLLSEDIETRLEYLFLLEDLFRKAKLEKIYSNYLSDRLKNLGLENIPDRYQEIAEKKLLSIKRLIMKK